MLGMDPRIRARRAAVARQVGRRRLRALGVVLAIAGFVGLLGAVAYSPLLAVRHVIVQGALPGTRGEVLLAAGLKGAPPMIDVDAGAASAAIERIPWVLSAEVRREWPDTVQVRLRDRVPVAVVDALSGGTELVDATGRVIGLFMSVPPPTSARQSTPYPREKMGSAGLPAGSGTASGTASETRPSALIAASGALSSRGPLPLLEVPVKAGPPGSTLGREVGPGLATAAAMPPLLVKEVRAIVIQSPSSVEVLLAGGSVGLFGPPTDLQAKFEALASVLENAPPAGPVQVDLEVPSEPVVVPG